MKRELVAALFLIIFIGIYFLAVAFFGEEETMLYLSRFIVVGLMIAFSAGQYSMKFPKAF